MTYTLLLFAVFATVFAESPARVYVFAHKSADGFVESGRLSDSTKDLREAVAKLKGVALVEDERDAQIVLEVMQAGNVIVAPTEETKVRRGIFGGVDSTTTTKQETLPNLTVAMRIRGTDYSKELSITNQMFWKDLAKNIARQVDDWLKVNRAQLKN